MNISDMEGNVGLSQEVLIKVTWTGLYDGFASDIRESISCHFADIKVARLLIESLAMLNSQHQKIDSDLLTAFVKDNLNSVRGEILKEVGQALKKSLKEFIPCNGFGDSVKVELSVPNADGEHLIPMSWPHCCKKSSSDIILYEVFSSTKALRDGAPSRMAIRRAIQTDAERMANREKPVKKVRKVAV
jgi:hypothetical protein